MNGISVFILPVSDGVKIMGCRECMLVMFSSGWLVNVLNHSLYSIMRLAVEVLRGFLFLVFRGILEKFEKERKKRKKKGKKKRLFFTISRPVSLEPRLQLSCDQGHGAEKFHMKHDQIS